MHLFLNIVASAIAAIAARICTHPIDTIKIRLQTSSSQPKNYSLLSLYAGIIPAIAFSVPALSVYLCTYDYCKGLLIQLIGREEVWMYLISGTMSEITSNFLWVPMVF